jgi:hypothetical protein
MESEAILDRFCKEAANFNRTCTTGIFTPKNKGKGVGGRTVG